MRSSLCQHPRAAPAGSDSVFVHRASEANTIRTSLSRTSEMHISRRLTPACRSMNHCCNVLHGRTRRSRTAKSPPRPGGPTFSTRLNCTVPRCMCAQASARSTISGPTNRRHSFRDLSDAPVVTLRAYLQEPALGGWEVRPAHVERCADSPYRGEPPILARGRSVPLALIHRWDG